jgi:hypothetical protein
MNNRSSTVEMRFSPFNDFHRIGKRVFSACTTFPDGGSLLQWTYAKVSKEIQGFWST